MDTDLKCNRLTCRKALIDKAVVTTCSHIFCVECANELFNAGRFCPACETILTEPDDVVVCSLHPSNDYKTSVLSGLSPSIVVEICSRALSFWQYQIHQENSFQQAVTRNLSDRNAQLQKQLDNVIREANGEINLLGNKVAELERDLELQRRKVNELQDASRDREKEYQKLKIQHDKIKRKALLAPSGGPPGQNLAHSIETNHSAPNRQAQTDQNRRMGNSVDIGAVVGGMEASGIQRTPLITRTSKTSFGQQRTNIPWPQGPQVHQVQVQAQSRNSFQSYNAVENMLYAPHNFRPKAVTQNNGSGAWATSNSSRPRPGTVQHQSRPFNPNLKRGFKPASR
ncbi:hypothetical protein BJ138DRAFT_689197 [Hygrophoropsis aurantiaca]|uniref:Uncharacterized protein n=1 Tax=Hygrophoropsis aurantiaca TaxID=72124 RepID=A0ACB8ASE7_9AGAM|nr:hypothetical protein BJ138DRAFT_689197 [Hygrophoropsis aurantiaca]